MDPLDCMIAELRKRKSGITFELKQLETLKSKRQQCSNDVEEAICLLKSEFMDLRQVLAHFPDIGRKRAFWEALLCSQRDIPLFYDFAELLLNYAEPLLEDRDLVLKLCAYNAILYCDLSEHLQADEGILEVVLTTYPLALEDVHVEVQLMYPALVASAIERLSVLVAIPRFQDSLEVHIRGSLRTNRRVALAWASAGGRFLDSFPEEFKDDEELLVEFYRHHGDIPANFPTQLDPTPRLLADKQFMLKAVNIRPEFLAKVPGELAGDWDLLLAAMGNPKIADLGLGELEEGGYVENENDEYEFWIDASKKVRDKLRSHDIFVKLLLGGMMASTGGSTPLSLLNQGKETSVAFTRPIAEYLGVPMGEELRMLREARKNLVFVRVHWESSC